MDRLRRRIGDRHILDLVKAFLKAGILTEAQALWHPDTGTPQGGILSPLLANIALSVLDDHLVGVWDAGGGSTLHARRADAGDSRIHVSSAMRTTS